MVSERILSFQIILILLFIPGGYLFSEEDSTTILFTGDLMLGRKVAMEAEHLGRTPWHNVQSFLNGFDYVISNFEGAVGPAEKCIKRPPSLCLNVLERDFERWGKPPFNAVSLENNHSYDLGDEGLKNTLKYLDFNKIQPLTFESSPTIIEVIKKKLALIAINEITATEEIKPEIIKRKINLGEMLSDLTVIYIHWGMEYRTWPGPEMINKARWFIDQGADVVIGAHPHVIITPDIYKNRPIFYSLGNFIFDQKYRETKEGLLVLCNISRSNEVSFNTYKVETPVMSTHPHRISEESSFDDSLEQAVFQAERRHFMFNDTYVYLTPAKDRNKSHFLFFKGNQLIWKSRPGPVLSVYKTSLKPKLKDEVIVTVENHYSKIDNTVAPRVYVYEVTEYGLNALWRGSALAWPMLDIAFIHTEEVDYLCVLHRGDSFLVPDPMNKERIIAYYIWNGFGFNLLENVPDEIREKGEKIWLKKINNLSVKQTQ